MQLLDYIFTNVLLSLVQGNAYLKPNLMAETLEYIGHSRLENQSLRNILSELNFNLLLEMSYKSIDDLTESDFESIGLLRLVQVEGYYYACKDFSGNTRYFVRERNQMCFQCPASGKPRLIYSTRELILDVVLNWRLKGLGLYIEMMERGSD